MEIIRKDVLVIGGGCAGMQAVISAQQQGASIVHVLKRTPSHSGSSAYTVTEASGYGMGDGYRDPADSPDVHFQDIMLASRSMADPRLARILADAAPRTKNWLESIGVAFEKEGARYLVTQGCYGSKPRNYTLRRHGTKIIEALQNQELPDRVTHCYNCMITELLVEDGVCQGALGLLDDGESILFLAKSVVLCSGGAGSIFSTSLNPGDIVGDGYAMGYRSGAELMNMEFMQFGCGVAWPGFSILNSWIWSLHPTVSNCLGNNIFNGLLPEGVTEADVMDRKATHFPFSSDNISKYVEIAIQKARMEGLGGDHDGVLLDVSQILKIRQTSRELQLFSDMWKISNEWYVSRGIDVSSGPIEVSCYAHAVNGGLVIDPNAMTSIEGLYAAGEVASGPHGADRLGGNMLPTCIVFGDIAGKHSAEQALKGNYTRAIGEKTASVRAAVRRQAKNLIGGKGIPVGNMMLEIQQLMGTYMMVIRSEEHLSKLENMLYRFYDGLDDADRRDIHPFGPFELENAITTALLMVRSARWRKESRGSHFREDFPELDHHFSSTYKQSLTVNPLFKEEP